MVPPLWHIPIKARTVMVRAEWLKNAKFGKVPSSRGFRAGFGRSFTRAIASSHRRARITDKWWWIRHRLKYGYDDRIPF